MNERPKVGRANPARSFRAGAWLPALGPALFGTIGSGWTDLQVGFNCADHCSCRDLTCPPCATSLDWVLAQFVGEWIFASAAIPPRQDSAWASAEPTRSFDTVTVGSASARSIGLTGVLMRPLRGASGTQVAVKQSRDIPE
jgi:hypothetical protein